MSHRMTPLCHNCGPGPGKHWPRDCPHRAAPKKRSWESAFVELVRRVDASWFRTKQREAIPDGARQDAKELRTGRAVRLLAFWHFASGTCVTHASVRRVTFPSTEPSEYEPSLIACERASDLGQFKISVPF